jgi:hypothetical protein
MNVTVVEYYVPGCRDCIAIVENIVQSAVRDAAVSRMNLVATGKRHCHELEAGPMQQRMAAGAATGAIHEATPAPPPVPSGVLFSEVEVAGLAGRAVDDGLNGFDYQPESKPPN